jgi:glycine/D-amino acid oxidase-like deaminating enzyme
VTLPEPYPRSRWADTAGDTRTYPPPDKAVTADVAIVGGGYAGLSTAYHLHGLGRQATVLEANRIGWGGSGRNGSMVVPRYKKSFAAIAAQHGDATARALHRLLLDGIDTIEATIARHGIACDFARSGHLTAAYTPDSLEMLRRDALWLARVAGDEAPILLDRAAARDRIGSDAYVGGYLDPRGGGIHPLNYARGLARVLSELGLAVHEGAGVRRIARAPGGWVLDLQDGSQVTARDVAVTTGAYSDLLPFSRRIATRIVPVTTSIIATAPLTSNLARTILPGGELVSDTKRLMNYFRMLPGDRLMFGGRGGTTRGEEAAVARNLRQAMARTFPLLGDIAVDNTWSGQVDVTLDDFPHFGAEDGLYYALGFGGRGIVLTTVVGKLLAASIAGRPVEASPMSGENFRPIALHGLRVPVLRAIAAYYGWKDRRAHPPA